MAQGQEEPDPALSLGHLQWKIFLWCVQAMYGSLWQEGALHPLGERSVLPWGAACLGQGAGWSTAQHCMGMRQPAGSCQVWLGRMVRTAHGGLTALLKKAVPKLVFGTER